MKIELISAIDYDKLKELLEKQKFAKNSTKKVIEIIKELENKRRTDIVSTAGRLSRFQGNVYEVLDQSEMKSLINNIKFINRVTSMGHNSIEDHDYCVFALSDVSAVVEQTIIAERFSSFTIKSRREVNFSNAGFYTPIFRDNSLEEVKSNTFITEEYLEHENSLFNDYAKLVDMGIPLEDARYVTPYSFNSNILMGVDAHTLEDMIIKFTKTKYANIQELKEFGLRLYEIAKEKIPYIADNVDKAPIQLYSSVEEFLNNNLEKEDYYTVDDPKILNHSQNIDDTILIAALMRRYRYDFDHAAYIYQEAIEKDSMFKEKLMKKIAFEDDGLELSQVNFDLQLSLSYAVLTHLTRHRTHRIIVPDFVPNPDLTQYQVPPTIVRKCLDYYREIMKKNNDMYNHFKNDYQICPEDLVYFTLAGTLTNIVTNMNGQDLYHILGLRECNKSQWETRAMAYGIHKEINNLPDAQNFSKILGATCETQGFCKEGKECCGRIYKLKGRK